MHISHIGAWEWTEIRNPVRAFTSVKCHEASVSVLKYQALLDTNVFCLHCKYEHDGILQRLEISVECKRPSDAMFRQISEAVYIERDDPDLNKRSEWGNRNVPWHRKESRGIPS